MAQLEQLPEELLVTISEMINDVRGLASLAKTNHRLNAIATGPLYKQTVNHGTNETLFLTSATGPLLIQTIIYGANETLVWASATGQIGTLELLARHGQDIHVNVPGPDESGQFPHIIVYRSALDSAARNGQARVAEWLLRHGADVNGNTSSSPLRTALFHGKYGVAHVLLSTWDAHFEGYWEDLWCLGGATVWQRALEAADVSPVLGFPASIVADRVSVISDGEAGVEAVLSEEEEIIEAVGVLLDPVSAVDAYRYQGRKIDRTPIPFYDTAQGRELKARREHDIDEKKRLSDRTRLRNTNAACACIGKLCRRWGQKQCRGAGCLACRLFDSASANRDRLRY